RDWSSDVCSSDLVQQDKPPGVRCETAILRPACRAVPVLRRKGPRGLKFASRWLGKACEMVVFRWKMAWLLALRTVSTESVDNSVHKPRNPLVSCISSVDWLIFEQRFIS